MLEGRPTAFQINEMAPRGAKITMGNAATLKSTQLLPVPWTESIYLEVETVAKEEMSSHTSDLRDCKRTTDPPTLLTI